MGRAVFYHLTQSTPEKLLPHLIGKARGAGWRVALKGRDPDQIERLDQALWRGQGFLPHGIVGGPHDARQPVLLMTEDQAAANPDEALRGCLISVDGAQVAPHEAVQSQRSLILFDGADLAAVEHARGQWRALTGAGVEAEYWAEDAGGWACRAKSKAAGAE